MLFFIRSFYEFVLFLMAATKVRTVLLPIFSIIFFLSLRSWLMSLNAAFGESSAYLDLSFLSGSPYTLEKNSYYPLYTKVDEILIHIFISTSREFLQNTAKSLLKSTKAYCHNSIISQQKRHDIVLFPTRT